jgi:hypothetical protein
MSVMFHITCRSHRASILERGLLPTRPDGGSEARRQDNAEGVYVFACDRKARRYWYQDTEFDVWQVDVADLDVQPDPRITGAFRVPHTVTADRVELLNA